MFCKKCGKEIDDEAIFCPECGEKVVTTQKFDNSLNQDSNSKKNKLPVKKKKSHKNLFTCIILLALLLSATVGWIVYPYHSEKVKLNNGGYYISKRYKKASIVYEDSYKKELGYHEISRRYFDGTGKACTDDYGWHKYTWEYDSNGQESKVYCYGSGKDYELCVIYDRPGHSDHWTRYDRNGNMKGNSSGIAKVSYIVNKGVCLFGADGKPFICEEGWSCRLIENDKISYYGVDGKHAVRSSNDILSGWSVCEYKKDGLYLYDANMKPVNCKAGWQSLRKKKEAKGRIAIAFLDKNGNYAIGKDEWSPKLGERYCFAFAIYENHADTQDGDTVWYDQTGHSIKADRSAYEAEQQSIGPHVFETDFFSSFNPEEGYYIDYLSSMFQTLSWSENDYMLSPCVATPKTKWDEIDKTKKKENSALIPSLQ